MKACAAARIENRMPIRIALIVLHAVLLLVASTSFTIMSGFGDGIFSWEYFRYASQRGWGVPYQFAYSLPVVLTYLAAYAVGIVGYGLTWGSGFRFVGVAGTLLYAVSFVSFAYELTHQGDCAMLGNLR